MEQAGIGVIGGSGLYAMKELQNTREVTVDTPFGPPSDSFLLGTLDGVEVAFLARQRPAAQTAALGIELPRKYLGPQETGVRRIVSASAVGSLKLEHKPWISSCRTSSSIGLEGESPLSSGRELSRTFHLPIPPAWK